MQEVGNIPEGLEVGNAWANRCPDIPQTNWTIGMLSTIPPDSLRHIPQRDLDQQNEAISVRDLCVKWFVHQPDDPLAWGMDKTQSTGRSLAMLTNDGEFEITSYTGKDRYIVTFDQPDDFAVWGADLTQLWQSLQVSSALTVR